MLFGLGSWRFVGALGEREGGGVFGEDGEKGSVGKKQGESGVGAEYIQEKYYFLGGRFFFFKFRLFFCVCARWL